MAARLLRSASLLDTNRPAQRVPPLVRAASDYEHDGKQDQAVADQEQRAIAHFRAVLGDEEYEKKREFLTTIETLPLDKNIKFGLCDNGARYMVWPCPNPKAVLRLRLVVDFGSVDEEKDERGLAHLLEHMVFENTEHFPKRQLFELLDKLGISRRCDVNGFTSYENTCYDLTINFDDLAEAPDKTALTTRVSSALLALADMGRRAIFLPEHLEKEQKVVQEEERYRRNVEREQVAQAILCNTPYVDHMPIGDMAVVRAATCEQLKKLYDKWYRPCNFVLLVAGDMGTIGVDEMVKLCTEHLAPLKDESGIKPEPPLPGRWQDHKGVEFFKRLGRHECDSIRRLKDHKFEERTADMLKQRPNGQVTVSIRKGDEEARKAEVLGQAPTGGSGAGASHIHVACIALNQMRAVPFSQCLYDFLEQVAPQVVGLRLGQAVTDEPSIYGVDAPDFTGFEALGVTQLSFFADGGNEMPALQFLCYEIEKLRRYGLTAAEYDLMIKLGTAASETEYTSERALKALFDDVTRDESAMDPREGVEIGLFFMQLATRELINECLHNIWDHIHIHLHIDESVVHTSLSGAVADAMLLPPRQADGLQALAKTVHHIEQDGLTAWVKKAQRTIDAVRLKNVEELKAAASMGLDFLNPFAGKETPPPGSIVEEKVLDQAVIWTLSNGLQVVVDSNVGHGDDDGTIGVTCQLVSKDGESPCIGFDWAEHPEDTDAAYSRNLLTMMRSADITLGGIGRQEQWELFQNGVSVELNVQVLRQALTVKAIKPSVGLAMQYINRVFTVPPSAKDMDEWFNIYKRQHVHQRTTPEGNLEYAVMKSLTDKHPFTFAPRLTEFELKKDAIVNTARNIFTDISTFRLSISGRVDLTATTAPSEAEQAAAAAEEEAKGKQYVIAAPVPLYMIKQALLAYVATIPKTDGWYYNPQRWPLCCESLINSFANTWRAHVDEVVVQDSRVPKDRAIVQMHFMPPTEMQLARAGAEDFWVHPLAAQFAGELTRQRLDDELREAQQIVYGVQHSFHPLSVLGLRWSTFTMTCDAAKVPEVVTACATVFMEMCDKGASEQAVNLLLRGIDSASYQARQAAAPGVDLNDLSPEQRANLREALLGAPLYNLLLFGGFGSMAFLVSPEIDLKYIPMFAHFGRGRRPLNRKEVERLKSDVLKAQSEAAAAAAAAAAAKGKTKAAKKTKKQMEDEEEDEEEEEEGTSDLGRKLAISAAVVGLGVAAVAGGLWLSQREIKPLPSAKQ